MPRVEARITANLKSLRSVFRGFDICSSIALRQANAPVQRRAAQRTVRCNRLLGCIRITHPTAAAIHLNPPFLAVTVVWLARVNH